MKVNNYVFLCVLSIIISLVCLPLAWYTFVAETGSILMQGSTITSTGLNGLTGLLGLRLNHWFLILVNVLVSATLILTAIKVISLKYKWLLAPLFVVLAYGLFAIYLGLELGSVKLGSVLFVISVLLNFIAIFKQKKLA